MKQLLLIGLGSGIGGVFRYSLSTFIHKFVGRSFPLGTLAVNTLGCFLMGLLFIVILERFTNYSESLRAFLLLGFLGGFTTFSSFPIETFNMVEYGEFFYALLNMLFSLFLCLFLTWLGILIGRELY